MNTKLFKIVLASAILVPAAIAATIAIASDAQGIPERPDGPCFRYAEPCRSKSARL